MSGILRNPLQFAERFFYPIRLIDNTDAEGMSSALTLGDFSLGSVCF
jgi:hypothetical protein